MLEREYHCLCIQQAAQPPNMVTAYWEAIIQAKIETMRLIKRGIYFILSIGRAMESLSNCKQDNALGLWSWGSAERFFLDIANKHFPQRMMQPPPPPPAFLCHSFTPSNEVVNGSFDAGSFSTKSRMDSHASLLFLASLHCLSVANIFCIEGRREKMMRMHVLNDIERKARRLIQRGLTSNSSARVFASFSSFDSLVMGPSVLLVGRLK